MKKGFTLIELLAVIVVLGVIGIISVPIYLNAIQAQREKAFIESEKGIIRGIKNYLTFNQELYPQEINDLEVVSFKTLQEGKFIGEIKSLTGSNCSGYVVVVKTSEVTYDYNPYYKCDGTELNNPAEEGLILDYPFKDYQEPTSNLISDVYGAVYGGYPGLTITDEIDNDAPTDHAKKVEINMEPINTSARIKFGDATNIQADTYYFATIYIKKDPSVSANIVPRLYSGVSWYNMTALDDYGDDYIKDSYRRFGAYIYTGINSGGPNPAFGAFDYGASTGDVFYFSSPQVEEKQSPTPFTENTRDGIIKDYSMNERNSSLVLATTPSWNSDRGGSYLFDGSLNLIRTSNFNGTSAVNEFTYSMWYKVDQEQGYLLWQNSAILLDVGHLSLPGQMRLRLSLDGDWRTGYAWDYSLNEWTHLVITWDGINTKIYQNGNLIVNSTADSAYSQTTTATNDLDIGARDANSFNGSISDVKIYTRALLESEVKNLYGIEKLK